MDPRRLDSSQWSPTVKNALQALEIATWEDLARTPATVLLRQRGIGWHLLSCLAAELHGRGYTVLWDAARPRVFQSGVYFIQCGMYVKIGRTHDLDQRLTDLQIAVPFDLQLLGLLPCSAPELALRELELHQRFAALRYRGEWFRLQDPILLYVAALQEGVFA